MVGVYNSSGTKLVTFKYDAYGNCTMSGDTVLAQYCKIRYRGYYFDTETGLYWVQTRYYNPQWCRWISPDTLDYLDPETAHGLNLYAYCGNDPINYVDPSGHLIVELIAALILGLATIIGATIGGVTARKQALARGESDEDLIKSIIKGIFIGGAFGLAAGGLILSAVSMGGVILAPHLHLAFETVKLLYAYAAAGMAIYNIIGIVVGALFGVDVQLLEWGEGSYSPSKPKSNRMHHQLVGGIFE